MNLPGTKALGSRRHDASGFPLLETNMHKMGFADLDKAVNLRFVLTDTGGIWLARKPVVCTYKELQAFCQHSEWRVARKAHLALAHTPFSDEGYQKEKHFAFPWGRSRSPFSARRIFVERGVSVAGLFNGPAPNNIWWFAFDEETNALARYYSAGNTGVFDHFLRDGKMWIENAELAEAILAVAAAEAEAQKDYLRSFGGELEDNEGFALQKPATPEELAFITPVLKEMATKLTADSGVLWVSPVQENRMFFGAGGGCSGCSRLRINTFKVFAQAVKAHYPEVEVLMYPEVQDWDEANLYESYEELARRMIDKPSGDLLNIL